jgi:CCR4-NOT transcription complex subunit 9
MQQASIHSGSADGGSGDQAQDKEKLYQLVAELSREETREAALLELSKKREAFPDLAPILWHSFGTTATLLQEIVCIYPLLSPPQLTAHASNRVCNALALLQCVASHPETRTLFLKAHIPLFLYPFLNTISKTRPFEYLRLTSLGVIGALVKMDDSDVLSQTHSNSLSFCGVHSRPPQQMQIAQEECSSSRDLFRGGRSGAMPPQIARSQGPVEHSHPPCR